MKKVFSTTLALLLGATVSLQAATTGWDEASKTLTITVTTAGELTDDYINSLTQNQKEATQVCINGEGVTLSDADLAAMGKFTALHTLDLSAVGVADYGKIGLYNYNNKIDLVVPAATAANADQVSHLRLLCDNAATLFNNIYSFHTNVSGVIDCFAYNLNYNDFDFSTVASGKCGNLVYFNNENDWSLNTPNIVTSLVNEINKVKGVNCLVLSNMFNAGGIDLSGIANADLKRLILPDGYYGPQGWSLDKMTFAAGCGIKVVQVLKADTEWKDGESIVYNNYYTHSMVAGGLSAISNCHYYQQNLTDAYSAIFSGYINEDDVEFLNGMTNNRLNLAGLIHEDAEGNTFNLQNALAKLHNDHVEYLALPDGVRYPSDPTFASLYANNPSLIAVGVYVEEAQRNSMVINSTKELGIYAVQKMLGTTRMTNATKYQFSGLASVQDLSNGADIYVDDNGHIMVTEETDAKSSNYRKYSVNTTGKKVDGLMKAPISVIDLSLLKLDNTTPERNAAAQNDLCFSLLGAAYNSIDSIALPRDKSVYRLPNGALETRRNLLSICIPSNYKELGYGCLRDNQQLRHVFTSYEKDGKTIYRFGATDYEEMPDTADIDYSCTLPLNLTRVESNAFGLDERFLEVYVTNNYLDEVPYCEKDAFSSGTLQGWGGFNGGHPITRQSYASKNLKGATAKTFGVLRYPNGLKSRQTRLYTDPDRDYSYADESGATDGNGNIIMWPTQSEWYRAFRQANSGYTWYDWEVWKTDANGVVSLIGGDDTNKNVDHRSDLISSGAATDYAKEMGLTAADINGSFNAFAPKADDGTTIVKETGDTYIGWHQFVLASAVNNGDNGKKWHITITDNNWWTICLPFSMTVAELEETFGENTRVCTLSSVVRNRTKNSITMKFGEDLVKKAKEENMTDALLVQRMPYMIKPGKQEKLTNENDDTNEYSGPVFLLSDAQQKMLEKSVSEMDRFKNKTVEEIRAITLAEDGTDCATVVTAIDENGNNVKLSDAPDAADYQYVFLGQYTKYYIPTYGYFLGWDETMNNGQGAVNYFFQSEQPLYQNWNAYTCTVGHYAPSQCTWTMKGTTQQDTEAGHYEWTGTKPSGYNPDDKNDYSRAVIEDSFTKTSFDTQSAKPTIGMDFSADETTSIEITTDGSIKTSPKGNVYSLSGQLVSENGLQGLAKGIYVANGRKYIVK